ncbi:hypothetical protein OH76DRAFT_184511 [Lentinus brumalis]|uniref:Uncharacterized protein n=1 Tax=Lentinus brumalis TaxID=2498619 RepID=A0A371CNA6_9APHY|nr:hypothetical protein OH76DRAFT_184511 [Polyporus brumalis]
MQGRSLRRDEPVAGWWTDGGEQMSPRGGADVCQCTLYTVHGSRKISRGPFQGYAEHSLLSTTRRTVPGFGLQCAGGPSATASICQRAAWTGPGVELSIDAAWVSGGRQERVLCDLSLCILNPGWHARSPGRDARRRWVGRPLALAPWDCISLTVSATHISSPPVRLAIFDQSRTAHLHPPLLVRRLSRRSAHEGARRGSA